MFIILKFIFKTFIVGLLFVYLTIDIQSKNSLFDPETVYIPAGDFSFQMAGDFRRGNIIVDAPIQKIAAKNSFYIMKYHVSQKDYALCVADLMCENTIKNVSEDYPQVNVNFLDATKYAYWLSKKTNKVWRLPSEKEWVRAAGNFNNDIMNSPEIGDIDLSKRWIKKYKEETFKRGKSDPQLRKAGYYGENNLGVADINGNIWEWTTACFRNGKVSNDGKTLISHSDYCGVRLVKGKHHTFVIDFIRDAKSGGCAVGTPPDNLGIRLVLDPKEN